MSWDEHRHATCGAGHSADGGSGVDAKVPIQRLLALEGTKLWSGGEVDHGSNTSRDCQSFLPHWKTCLICSDD